MFIWDSLDDLENWDESIKFFKAHKEFNPSIKVPITYKADVLNGVESLFKYRDKFVPVIGERAWSDLKATLDEMTAKANKLLTKSGISTEEFDDYLRFNNSRSYSFSVVSIPGQNFDLAPIGVHERSLFIGQLTQRYNERSVTELDPITYNVKSWKVSSGSGFLPELTLSRQNVEPLTLSRNVLIPESSESLDESGYKTLLEMNEEFIQLWESAAREVLNQRKSEQTFITDILFNEKSMARISDSSRKQGTQSHNLVDKLLYPQDWFHVRGPEEGKMVVNLSKDIPSLRDLLMQNSSLIADDIVCLKDEPLIDIAGGNMFVFDDVAFVGADELLRYEGDENLRDLIGALSDSRGHIEAALKRCIFGQCKDKKLIWVGDIDNCRLTYDNGLGYQPMYHIDLFFHPLGFVNDEAKANKEFSFLFGLFREGAHFEDQKISFDHLRHWLNDTYEKLKTDLVKLGFNPKPLEIEHSMFFLFNSQGVTIWYPSFLNGVSELRDGKIRYLFPKNKQLRPTSDKPRILRFLDLENNAFDKIEGLLGAGNVLNVPSNDYTEVSGLHCLVKVFKRGRV
jgi:hypothetical protein